ncbi:hypothetical protein PO864_14015 [Providencia alcalifaciens]|uniref:Uncharacterized protein n=1 Tax=Providencia alcalifaciens 205/92 TaxID=1256988 RepID=A0AAV3M8K6_9GAMM|nr:hypothetical protein [Providencia alcalifaciens]EUD12183.1 hypothetical protein HMPREF1563_1351 [Providencia alcalifaciens 205/92]WGZ53361.1 hypothetical protein PO864_14015 [Providencia alcalifaciens]
MDELILTNPQPLNALRDIIKNRLQNHHDKSTAQGIAVYGFATQQLNNCHYLYSTKPRKAITTISNFNTKLDLVKGTFNYQLSHRDYIYQLSFRQVDNFIDALYENKPKYYLYVGNKNLAPYLHAWKEYLNKSSHKIDLFKYIHSKEISIEEKTKLLKNLLLKTPLAQLTVKSYTISLLKITL